MVRAMLCSSLGLGLLVVACGGSDPVGSRAEAKTPVTREPTPLPGPSRSPTTTTPTQTDGPQDGAAPTRPPPKEREGPEPFHRPHDATRGADELVFWGWSADGRHFAFETYFRGAGMAECEGEAELTIVDAQTDRYAADGHVVVRHRDPDAEVCDPPDLREELGYRRDPRLHREGISTALGTGPIPIEGSGEQWRFVLPSGEAVELSFRVRHGTDDPMEAADGAAYELRMTVPGGEEVVVERGLRRRPWIMGYDLSQGMVFVGPHGAHAAILVAQEQVIPEGTRTTWMANGVALR